ncbi:exopolysaccharide production protein ExoZ [Inquilinus ginsengisoli]
MRGLAATVVALGHSQYGAAGRLSTDFFSWDHMLGAGVDLFFVISGFIMMLVSDPASGRESTPGIFLLRRFQRIVPLYWFYTLLLVVSAILVPSLLRWTTLTPDLVFTSLFFIPSFHPVNGLVQPLLSIGWTLQYEMFFYLCFAAVLGLSLGARVVAMTVLFAGLMVLTSAIGRETAILSFLGNPIVFEFVAGMGVYWLYCRGWVTRRAAVPIAAVALPVVVWLVGSGTAAPLEDVLDRRWLRAVVWGVPALLVFYVGLAIHDMPGAAGRALAKLGDASYSLYLSHVFVAAILGKGWAALGHGPSSVFGALVVLPCCIVAALVSYSFVERPLGAMARRAAGLLQKAPQTRPS